MKRFAAVLLVLGVVGVVPGVAIAEQKGRCGSLLTSTCGVQGDAKAGDFHGLIMVNGDPNVLDIAAHSGTQPGCGDCEWTLVANCVFECTNGGQARRCNRGEVAYRLYLTTNDFTNRLVDTLCLGGPQDVIPVGDVAAADVQNYLKDVTPPTMQVTVQPPNGVLSNLPAYFQAAPPDNLQPQQFGGPQVTENITITAAHYTWDWGDGSAPYRTDDPGGPYPDGQVTHTYDRSAHVTAELTTEWSATYTITVAGQIFGPYNATGTVRRTQRFPLVVNRARSHLVSH